MKKRPFVSLKNVYINFPIFNGGSSFKNKLLTKMTGGNLKNIDDKFTVVEALKNINFEINTGDRLGIVGHNGSGKSTLLRALSGVYYPSMGEVEIHGNVNSLLNITSGINPEATGRDNIRIRFAFMGIDINHQAKLTDEIIDYSGLGNFIDLPFRTYSTGMQLRLAFAIATSINTDILIMDEWLSTGDNNFAIKANKRLNDLIKKSNILILASHSIDLIEKNCNRIILLREGSVIKEGKNVKKILEYYVN